MRPFNRPAALAMLGLLLHQHLLAQHSGFGIKGGLAVTDLRSGAFTSQPLPNACVGGYFALRAGVRLELQPELLLAAHGAGYALPDGGRASARLLYAQVPVVAKAYFSNVINAQAGLLMGRLLMARQSSAAGEADVTAAYEHWDYGLCLGLGADLCTGTDLGLRFYSGLAPVMGQDWLLFPRNRAITLSVGRRITRLKGQPVDIEAIDRGERWAFDEDLTMSALDG
ncbi:MAG: outer membrane beta-barrel protein, partial [Flavobacteriales bacterium]